MANHGIVMKLAFCGSSAFWMHVSTVQKTHCFIESLDGVVSLLLNANLKSAHTMRADVSDIVSHKSIWSHTSEHHVLVNSRTHMAD